MEDSPTQAARLRHLLESNDCRTRVAANGKQALEALRERRPYAPAYLLKRIQHMLLDQALRKAEGSRFDVGIALSLNGQKHFINAERQQILDLLISTYEQAVR